MKKRLLRVMVAAFSKWLYEHMEPAGRVALHILDARAKAILDLLPDSGGPQIETLEALDESSMRAGLDWLLTSMRTEYPDESAVLMAESLRLLLHRNVSEIVLLTHPPTLDVPDTTPDK